MPVDLAAIPVRPVPFAERDRTLRQPDALGSRVQAEFQLLLRSDSILRNVVGQLSARGSTGVVFGGWVRDQAIGILTTRRPPPRDIDLVVQGQSTAQLRTIVGPLARENMFGGYTLATTTTSLDIWPLDKTFLIVRDALPITFDSLPLTTVFRMNSIVFSPDELGGEAKITEAGAVAAISESQVDFQARHVPFPHVQVGRAAMYAAKLAFALAPEVEEFIRSVCAQERDLVAVNRGLDDYCPSMFVSAAKRTIRHVLARR